MLANMRLKFAVGPEEEEKWYVFRLVFIYWDYFVMYVLITNVLYLNAV